MKNTAKTDCLVNLHNDFCELIEKGKLNIKSAVYISNLDINAEQLWVLRFYKQHHVLPTIKQAKMIAEACEKKKLTLRLFRSIMETLFKRQKLVIDYSDLAPFFDEGTLPEQMKADIIKGLSYLTNNRS